MNYARAVKSLLNFNQEIRPSRREIATHCKPLPSTSADSGRSNRRSVAVGVVVVSNIEHKLGKATPPSETATHCPAPAPTKIADNDDHDTIK
jgi:hypothetical protein